MTIRCTGLTPLATGYEQAKPVVAMGSNPGSIGSKAHMISLNGGIRMLVVVTGDGPELAGRGRRTKTFRYLARVACEHGLPVFFTTPARFRFPSVIGGPAAHHSDGWVYRMDSERFWRHREVLRPTDVVVYDAMYLGDLQRQKDVYQRVHRSWIAHGYRFFNPILPAKDVLYRSLQKHDIAPALLPKTWMGVTPEKVLRLLEVQQRVWLKPVIGSGGRNIMVLDKRSDGRYHVVAERFFGERRIDRCVSARQALELLRGALRRRSYMAQEEVPLNHTEDGRKVDFRATVVRGQGNDWRTIALTARIGASGSLLTNFHAGGKAQSLTSTNLLTPSLADGTVEDLLQHLRLGAQRVAAVLQRHSPRLGLLGVDLGTTADGRVYVYDFNGRPGRDILRDVEIYQMMDALVDYSRWLLQSRVVRRWRSAPTSARMVHSHRA